jgi:hypothetical protein
VNQRGAIGLTLLLVLGALVGGFVAGIRWDHRPIEIPGRVAIDSMHLMALKQVHDREVAVAHRADDSVAAAVQAAAAAGERETAANDRAKQLADSLRLGRLAIQGPDITLRDSLRFWQNTSYAFNAENIALRLAIDRGDSALAATNRALRGAQWRANLLLSSWTTSENELARERALYGQDLTDLKAVIRSLRAPRSVRVGLGMDALAVLGSSPCFASVAGPQLTMQTWGWLKVDGRATAGYGASGCVGESPRTGPAVQIGGSIGL